MVNNLYIYLFIILLLVSCGGGDSSNVSTPIPAPTTSISANPTSLFVDEQVTIFWSSTDSSACEASESWVGARSTEGQETITITTDGAYVYKIKCTGSGGSSEASVTVTAEYKTQFKEEPIIINDLNH